MAPSSRFLNAGSAVAASRVFSLVCAAIQLPILTRLLAPSEYAQFAVVIAVATYFSLVAAEPDILAFQRFPSTSEDRRNYRYALLRALGISVALGLVGIIVCLFLGHVTLAIAISGWGIGIAVTRLVSTAWLMWGIPWRYAANLAASTGVRTASLLLLVMSGVELEFALMWAGLLSAAAALSISPSLKRRGKLKIRPWAFGFAIHLALASLAHTLLTNSVLIVSPIILGGHEAGRLAAMLQLATLSAGAIVGLFTTVAYPSLRKLWDDGAELTVTNHANRLSTVIIGIVASVLGFAALADYWIVETVVGSTYTDHAVIPPLLAAMAFSSLGQVASWQHQFRLHAKTVSRRTWTAAGVGMGLILVGSLTLGITGASLGVSAGFLLYYMLMRWGLDGGKPIAGAAVTFFSATTAAALLPVESVSTVSALVGISIATVMFASLFLQRRADD